MKKGKQGGVWSTKEGMFLLIVLELAESVPRLSWKYPIQLGYLQPGNKKLVNYKKEYGISNSGNHLIMRTLS